MADSSILSSVAADEAHGLDDSERMRGRGDEVSAQGEVPQVAGATLGNFTGQASSDTHKRFRRCTNGSRSPKSRWAGCSGDVVRLRPSGVRPLGGHFSEDLASRLDDAAPDQVVARTTERGADASRELLA